jgi:hypothetical protein
MRKLQSNTREELASMVNISTTSWEEEAGPETALLKVFACDSASNRRLSRPGHAIQPEDAPLVLSVSPAEYLLKNVDAGIMESSGFMLFVVRIEGGICSVRQTIEWAL